MATISPSLSSAQDIARALHYPGDWRRLRYDLDLLNPGLRWDRLQPGQRLLLPESVAQVP